MYSGQKHSAKNFKIFGQRKLKLDLGDYKKPIKNREQMQRSNFNIRLMVTMLRVGYVIYEIPTVENPGHGLVSGKHNT